MKRYRGIAGFTIIELMVVVFVTAILLALAVPGFKTLLQNNRSAAQSRTFYDALNYARAEAVKQRAQKVYVSTLDASANWQSGWRIWIPAGSNTSYVDGTDVKVREFPAFSGVATLTSSSPTGLTDIIFDSNGAATAMAGATSYGAPFSATLHYSPGSKYCMDIKIGPSGRVMMAVAGTCP